MHGRLHDDSVRMDVLSAPVQLAARLLQGLFPEITQTHHVKCDVEPYALTLGKRTRTERSGCNLPYDWEQQGYGVLSSNNVSAFHPSRVGKWVPAPAGKANAGMVHSAGGCTRGVQVKLWDPSRTRAIPRVPQRCVHDKALYKSTFIFAFTFTFAQTKHSLL